MQALRANSNPDARYAEEELTFEEEIVEIKSRIHRIENDIKQFGQNGMWTSKIKIMQDKINKLQESIKLRDLANANNKQEVTIDGNNK